MNHEVPTVICSGIERLPLWASLEVRVSMRRDQESEAAMQ